MKNLNPKSIALSVFVVFVVCAALVSIKTGESVTDFRSAISIGYKALPLVLLILTGFVLHGWKWRIFRGWLVPFPNVNGTWQGTIHTTWRDPETGERPGPIPVILSIRQSFVRISCTMRTAEMTSRSFLADFWLDAHEQIRMLGYSYYSEPLPAVQDRSRPHNGTILFQLVGEPVTELKGVYWTARGSSGEVNLKFRESNRLESFPNDLGPHPVSGR